MPFRVTEDEVRKIIDTSIDDASISMFIDTANVLINEKLLGSGLSEQLLAKIELYLTAHFITLRDKVLKREEMGESENQYYGNVGMGLESSSYGQNVLVLDSSNILRDANKPIARWKVLT